MLQSSSPVVTFCKNYLFSLSPSFRCVSRRDTFIKITLYIKTHFLAKVLSFSRVCFLFLGLCVSRSRSFCRVQGLNGTFYHVRDNRATFTPSFALSSIPACRGTIRRRKFAFTLRFQVCSARGCFNFKWNTGLPFLHSKSILLQIVF